MKPRSNASGVLTYLARARYFVDGNKRAAWGGCVRALETNGFTIVANTADIIVFVDDLVVKKLGIQDVADKLGEWIYVLVLE